MSNCPPCNCPLCNSLKTEHYHQGASRNYSHCPTCGLVFVPNEFLLSGHDEKKIYDHHENDPNDQGYRKHLEKLATPLHQKLKPHSTGLDFGSGPGPALSVILEEKGHVMKIYDPFYANDKTVLTPATPYDFITMSEVLEHIYDPQKNLAALWRVLKPNGLMAIMTSLNEGQEFFKNWHYKNDPTHVRFYSKQTFKWLAEHFDAEVTFPDKNVIFLKKLS